MKYLIIALVLTLGFTQNVIADHTKNAPEKIQAGQIDPSGTLITIDANGLVCDFCARALEKVFMKQKGVSGIDVNLDSGKILISLEKGAAMDDDTLRKLVTDAGYNISSIERSPEHSN